MVQRSLHKTELYKRYGKNKETSVVATTFKSTADFKSGVYDTLPIYIFYPEKQAE